jgi:hypothetical protein
VTNVLASVPWGKRGGFRTLGGHFFRLFFERGSSSEAISGCPPWEVVLDPPEGSIRGQIRGSRREFRNQIFEVRSRSIGGRSGYPGSPSSDLIQTPPRTGSGGVWEGGPRVPDRPGRASWGCPGRVGPGSGSGYPGYPGTGSRDGTRRSITTFPGMAWGGSGEGPGRVPGSPKTGPEPLMGHSP